MKLILERLKIVVEPAGAATLAALIRYKDRFRSKNVGVLLSGGNLDVENISCILKPHL